jgi:hypothetical protein
MREIKSLKKTSVLKKIFIKICRLLGYELIDQSTLEFPVSNKNYSNHISIPGKKSFSLGSGEIPITRKVKGIDIIIKTCTSVQLVSQNKKRIFEKEKFDYTFRTIKSLNKSAEELKKKFPNIFIQFTIIDVGSPQSDMEKILSFFSKEFKKKLVSLDPEKLKYSPKTIDKNNKRIENNMATTMATIHESFILAKNCEDLVYFVEDDYIHKPEALTEMVFSYEKFSSIFQKELILLSTDYPYLYKKLENSNILLGENFHWRTVKESLLTFMTSKKVIEKHFVKLIDMSTNESNPFEKNLHEIYEKELCLSPLPSLSIHCTNINSVFGLSPNINLKKLWERYEN